MDAICTGGDVVVIVNRVATPAAFVFTNGWSLGCAPALVEFDLAQAPVKEDCQGHSGVVGGLTQRASGLGASPFPVNTPGQTDFDAAAFHRILESKQSIRSQSADTIAVLRHGYRGWEVLEASPKSKPATLDSLC